MERHVLCLTYKPNEMKGKVPGRLIVCKESTMMMCVQLALRYSYLFFCGHVLKLFK
jgi:hypothetical protein